MYVYQVFLSATLSWRSRSNGGAAATARRSCGASYGSSAPHRGLHLPQHLVETTYFFDFTQTLGLGLPILGPDPFQTFHYKL